ncbi:polysaccharide deacetylase family protein [Kiritimatiellota bacterium B12222]|nr:polysaccharide deacetylase family protein [Kiritimatiellota bacterium B12222]
MTSHTPFTWPDGQQCAVSLTYDDAIPVHYERVAPLLTEKGLTATFYICAHGGFTSNPAPWKQVAAQGHELGNHSLFHPCRREPEENYSWLSPHYDLCDYSSQRWTDEMRVASCLLNQLDGETDRTFGNTCCHTSIGRGNKKKDLSELIDNMFVAARGPLTHEIVTPQTLSFPALGHFSGDRKTFGEMQPDIERAINMKGWMILMFHGVGEGTHGHYIETEEHTKLLNYLEEKSKDIWTASLVKVAKHLKNNP